MRSSFDICMLTRRGHCKGGLFFGGWDRDRAGAEVQDGERGSPGGDCLKCRPP